VSRSLEDLERDKWLGEAESLAQIVTHPSWVRYEELLVQMRLSVLEHLSTATDPLDVARFQGAAAVLREIKDRPHQIVASARQVMEDEATQAYAARLALDGAVPLEDDL